MRHGSCGEGRAAFVVLAGGSGTRVGAGVNKVYLPVAGRPVIAWSLRWAARVRQVGPVLLVVRAGDEDAAADAVAASGLRRRVEVVTGGSTRHRSEQAAFDALAGRVAAGTVRVVAVHDGARPLAGPELLAEVIERAAERGGAVPTLPVEGVWQWDGGALLPPEDGIELHRVQTPQAFRAAPLLAAYAAALRAGDEATDTAGTLERYGGPGAGEVVTVAGHPGNLKVTFPEDVAVAEQLLSEAPRRAPRPPAR